MTHLITNNVAEQAINSRLQKIASELHTGSLAVANTLLTRLIRAPVVTRYWREKYGAEVPNVVSFVQNYGFLRNPKLTAMVQFDPDNPRSNRMIIGAEFFRRRLTHSVTDLLFIMMHERNHVILRYLFGDDEDVLEVFRDLADKDEEGESKGWSNILNWMEDSYINGLSRRTVRSSLPERFYKEFELSSAALTNRSSIFLTYLESLVNEVTPIEPPLKKDKAGNDIPRVTPFDPVHEFSKLLVANNSEYKKRVLKFRCQPCLSSVLSMLTSTAVSVVKQHIALYDEDVRVPDYTYYMSSLHRFLMLLPSHMTQLKLPLPLVMKGLPDNGTDEVPPLQVPVADAPGGDGVADSFGELRRVPVKTLDPGGELARIIESMSSKERTLLGVGSDLLFDIGSLEGIMGMTSDIVSGAPHQDLQQISSMFPPQRFTRRDGFLLSAGIELVQYQHVLEQVSLPAAYVRLYVDVSGSMEQAYSVIPWVCTQLKTVGINTSQFSALSSLPKLETTPEELQGKLKFQQCRYRGESSIALVDVDPANGILWTCYGTDYNIVAKDILDNDTPCAVILTDTTDTIDSALFEKLRDRCEQQLLNIYVINYTSKDFDNDSMLAPYERSSKYQSFYILARKVVQLKHRA